VERFQNGPLYAEYTGKKCTHFSLSFTVYKTLKTERAMYSETVRGLRSSNIVGVGEGYNFDRGIERLSVDTLRP
jgi:hypothetical protein